MLQQPLRVYPQGDWSSTFEQLIFNECLTRARRSDGGSESKSEGTRNPK
jgi:hypothetical protein